MKNNPENIGQCDCSAASPCCGSAKPSANLVKGDTPAPWISGLIITSAGNIPRISTKLTWRDIIGSWKARWSIGRMKYHIKPGIYAVNHPYPQSPVLVTANYKMSFDVLRKELDGIDAWVLVLDTKGINVWCAAGKGTFGTEELITRISLVQLARLVTHRTLILPQLGAPGVSAQEVKKSSGFKVIYGPVRAQDIPGFLRAGLKADKEMRQVDFGFLDRLVLTPVELTAAIKPGFIFFAALFLTNLLMDRSASFHLLLNRTILGFVPFLGAVLAGAVLAPALLPFIPGRSLAWKGWLMGMFWAVVYVSALLPGRSWQQAAAFVLLLPAIASFLTMNFTGATTYTSLSGVVKEMKYAIPLQLASAALGVAMLICSFIM